MMQQWQVYGGGICICFSSVRVIVSLVSTLHFVSKNMDATGTIFILIFCTFVILAIIFYSLVRFAASRAQPDDAKTWLFGLHVGFLCKTAYMLGITVPNLEKQRFRSYPYGESEPTVLNSENLKTAVVPKSKTIIVSFSGGAVRGIGIPRTEFRRTLQEKNSRTSKCDLLFVVDTTGMSFYHYHLDELKDLLQDVLKFYDKVVLMGNCMGATGALLYSSFIPSKCNGAVVAFCPEVDPASDSRLMFKLGSCVQPSICSSLRLKITNNILSSIVDKREKHHDGPLSVKYIIHSSCWQPEMLQVDSLTNSFADNGGKLELLSKINVTNEMNRDEVYKLMMGSKITPVLRISHVDVKFHHLVRQLKHAKKLVETLDLALEYFFEQNGMSQKRENEPKTKNMYD